MTTAVALSNDAATQSRTSTSRQKQRWGFPEFFIISHYNTPALDQATHRLDIGGLIARPQSLTMADLQARPRRDVTFTIEWRMTLLPIR